MNYRSEIIDMASRYTAQEYALPADSLILREAVEETVEYWFEGYFEFACGLDAQEAVGDSTLAHMVMVNYYQLEQEANQIGAGF